VTLPNDCFYFSFPLETHALTAHENQSNNIRRGIQNLTFFIMQFSSILLVLSLANPLDDIPPCLKCCRGVEAITTSETSTG
jgi:hypothetical protein